MCKTHTPSPPGTGAKAWYVSCRLFISHCGFYEHMQGMVCPVCLQCSRVLPQPTVGARGSPVKANTTQQFLAVSRAKYKPCRGGRGGGVVFLCMYVSHYMFVPAPLINLVTQTDGGSITTFKQVT